MCDFFLIDIDSHCKKTKKNQKQIQFNGKKKNIVVILPVLITY